MDEDQTRILIIHQEKFPPSQLVRLMEGLDWKVQLVSRFGEAARLLDSVRPNLIIVDLGIPADESYEAARILRSSQKTGATPILLLSEFAGKEEEISRSQNHNNTEAVDLLRKPFYPFELVSRCKALLHIRKYREQLETAEQVLQSLALAVEARDPTTGNHCDRLFARLSNMADILQLDDRSRDTLLKGAVLHDIGKIGVPDQILLKEGPLTDSEWEIMRQHVIIGESLCRPLKFLDPVLPVIRHHHERCDGSGYPDSLVRDEIPLAARIFQVCDVFDALTHKRPYKPALSREESMDLVLAEAKKGYWDIDIVNAFLAMLKSEVSHSIA